jgi:hypothetical protein
MSEGCLQTLTNQCDVVLWGLDALFRFLLKTVQNVKALRDLDRIDRSVGGALVIFNHFQNPCAAKALQRFGLNVLLA